MEMCGRHSCCNQIGFLNWPPQICDPFKHDNICNRMHSGQARSTFITKYTAAFIVHCFFSQRWIHCCIHKNFSCTCKCMGAACSKIPVSLRLQCEKRSWDSWESEARKILSCKQGLHSCILKVKIGRTENWSILMLALLRSRHLAQSQLRCVLYRENPRKVNPQQAYG